MARSTGLSLIARLNISLSESQISEDLKKISSNLDSKGLPSFIAHLNLSGSASAINKELAELGKKLKVDFGKITSSDSVSKLKRTGKDIAQSIYNVHELKKAGRDYIYNENNIQKQIDKLQSRYDKRSISLANTVNVKAVTNEIGKVKALTVEYQNLENQLVRVNYVKAKFTNKKTGYVSTGSIFTDNTEGKGYQQTLNYLNRIEATFRRINNQTVGYSSPIKEGSRFYDEYNAKAQSVAESIMKIRESNKILSVEQKTNIKSIMNDFEAYSRMLRQSAKGAESLAPKSLDQSIKQGNAALEILRQNIISQKGDIGSLNNQYKMLISEIDNLKTRSAGIVSSNQFTAWSNDIDNARNKYRQLKNSIKSTTEINQLSVKAANLSSKINLFISQNTKLSENAKQKLRELANQAEQAKSKMELNSINTQFSTFTNKLKEADKLGTSIFSKLATNAKKFASWFGMTTVIMRTITFIRNMINNVKELDTAMTNLKKVTDETDQTYKNFFESVGRSAQELHADMTNLIDATAEFAKLGYNISEAEELAKSAAIYKNVGELDSIEDASSSIVSTMKAFKIEANDSMQIVDKFNKVGKSLPIRYSNVA